MLTWPLVPLNGAQPTMRDWSTSTAKSPANKLRIPARCGLPFKTLQQRQDHHDCQACSRGDQAVEQIAVLMGVALVLRPTEASCSHLLTMLGGLREA